MNQGFRFSNSGTQSHSNVIGGVPSVSPPNTIASGAIELLQEHKFLETHRGERGIIESFIDDGTLRGVPLQCPISLYSAIGRSPIFFSAEVELKPFPRVFDLY